MEYEVHFVHAPSASGKTTFLKTGIPSQLSIRRSGQDLVLPNTLFRFGSCGLVDGDDIIHYTIGWPPNKEWWKLRGAELVHSAQLFALVNSAVRLNAPPWMTDLVIMFNGGMKKVAVAENLYAVDHVADSPVKLHHHTMLPSKEDHERNIESRRKENLKEGRSWTFPANWGDAHNNRESVTKMASLFGVAIHSNFEDVLLEISPTYKAGSVDSKESITEPTSGKVLDHSRDILELGFEELKTYLITHADWSKDVKTYDGILKKDKLRTIGSGCWKIGDEMIALSFNLSGEQVHVLLSYPETKDIGIYAFERWKDYRGGVTLTLTKLIHLIDNMDDVELVDYIMSDDHAPKITAAGKDNLLVEGDRDNLRLWEDMKANWDNR